MIDRVPAEVWARLDDPDEWIGQGESEDDDGEPAGRLPGPEQQPEGKEEAGEGPETAQYYTEAAVLGLWLCPGHGDQPSVSSLACKLACSMNPRPSHTPSTRDCSLRW